MQILRMDIYKKIDGPTIHIRPITTLGAIQLEAFYKSKKLASLFSLQQKVPKMFKHNIVDQYECGQLSGFTTNTLDVWADKKPLVA